MYRLNDHNGWTYCLHFEISIMAICQWDAAFIVIDLMIHNCLLNIIIALLLLLVLYSISCCPTCILMLVCWVECPATVEMAALILMQWRSAAFVYGFALLINMQTGGMRTRGWIVPLLLRDTACFLHRDCLSLTSLLPLKSGPLSSLRTASITLSPRGLHSHIHLISDLWLSLMSSSD